MKNFAPAIMIALLLASLCGGFAQAEVPPALARWMLQSPRPTQPLPAAESRAAPAASVASWADQYAWEFAPAAEAEVPQPLPPVEDGPGELRFAAGAIALSLPADWHVSESDHLRHVRLYVTLDELNEEEQFAEGLWISYHVLSSAPHSESQLREFLQRRTTDTLPPDARLSEARAVKFNGRSAIQQPYRLTSRPDVGGDHLLVAADWGVVEIQTRFQGPDQLQQITSVVDGIEIGNPRASLVALLQADQPLSDVVGAWKAERARLVLKGDGTVELHHDRQRLQQIEHASLARPARELRGRYTTEGDILHVQWDDDSRLNVRFSVTAGELMLTDHHGRISQLHRLFE